MSVRRIMGIETELGITSTQVDARGVPVTPMVLSGQVVLAFREDRVIGGHQRVLDLGGGDGEVDVAGVGASLDPSRDARGRGAAAGALAVAPVAVGARGQAGGDRAEPPGDQEPTPRRRATRGRPPR